MDLDVEECMHTLKLCVCVCYHRKVENMHEGNIGWEQLWRDGSWEAFNLASEFGIGS